MYLLDSIPTIELSVAVTAVETLVNLMVLAVFTTTKPSAADAAFPVVIGCCYCCLAIIPVARGVEMLFESIPSSRELLLADPA